jgi:hypothetical protein
MIMMPKKSGDVPDAGPSFKFKLFSKECRIQITKANPLHSASTATREQPELRAKDHLCSVVLSPKSSFGYPVTVIPVGRTYSQ